MENDPQTPLTNFEMADALAQMYRQEAIVAANDHRKRLEAGVKGAVLEKSEIEVYEALAHALLAERFHIDLAKNRIKRAVELLFEDFDQLEKHRPLHPMEKIARLCRNVEAITTIVGVPPEADSPISEFDPKDIAAVVDTHKAGRLADNAEYLQNIIYNCDHGSPAPLDRTSGE